MKNTITTICFCTLMTLFVSPAHAQWAKELAKIMFTEPSAKQAVRAAETTALYKWAPHQSREISSALYGKHSLSEHLANRAANLTNKPARISSFSAHTPTDSPATYVNENQLLRAIERTPFSKPATPVDKLALVRGSWETDALNGLHKEQQHYSAEIVAGRELRRQLLQIAQLNPAHTAQLQTAIDGLNSGTLRDYLTAELNTGDLAAMYQDLTDYYMLDGNPVAAAYNYTLRHPHKPNLWMRRQMRSPLVSPGLQRHAAFLLRDGMETPQQQKQFLTLLQRMNAEYEESLRIIVASEKVLEKITFYRQTTHALSNFIAENGHRPERNTADPQERKLALEIEFALTVINPAEPFASEKQLLQEIWDANEPPHWTMEETLQNFERFLQKDPTGYPQSLTENPHVSAQETALLNNLHYWYIRGGGNFQGKINALRIQYRP